MKENPKNIQLKRQRNVRAFNRDIVDSPLYEIRKKVVSTKIIYFDDDTESDHSLFEQDTEWCKISDKLANFTAKFGKQNNVVEFDRFKEMLSLRTADYIEACNRESCTLVKKILEIYLNYFEHFIDIYKLGNTLKYKYNLSELKKELSKNQERLIEENASIVTYAEKKIKTESKSIKKLNFSESNKLEQRDLKEKILRLKNEYNYSIKQICWICGISKYKFYSIIKSGNFNEESKVDLSDKKRVKTYLKAEEIRYIEELASNYSKNYKVPTIMRKLWKRFGILVPKSTIYYHLRKTLKFSYKKNKFRPLPFFRPSQKIIDYKVSKVLIELFYSGKNIVYVDETGCSLGQSYEFGYGKIGENAYRMSRTERTMIHLIMAISKKNVIAYQLRREAFSEHAFIDFMIHLAGKAIEQGWDYVSNMVVLIDCAPFHKSRLSNRLMNLLPFTVVYNSPNNPDFNGIETVFAVLKKEIKMYDCRDL